MVVVVVEVMMMSVAVLVVLGVLAAGRNWRRGGGGRRVLGVRRRRGPLAENLRRCECDEDHGDGERGADQRAESVRLVVAVAGVTGHLGRD